jgi:hypothetical protein
MVSIIKKALFSLRRPSFIAIVLVLLTILFSQLAGAAGNLDKISGTMFLDMNSNGKYDLSDLPLSGYKIYIDQNNNLNFDPGENSTQTSAAGAYNFTNIAREGSVRAWVLPRDPFQPSSPSPENGYNLSDVKDALKDRLDFGNKPMAAQNNNDSSTGLLWGFIFVSGLAILVCGGVVLGKGLLRLEGITNENLKENNAILQIVFGFILLFLGLYLWIVLLQLSGNTTSVAILGSGNSFSIVLPVVLALLVFGAILLMLYAHFNMRSSEPGEMRKTIAGLLVLGLVAVVFFAINGKILPENKEIITQYIQLVGIVVAFYFGSKAASDAYKEPEEAGNAQNDLDIENVTYNTEKAEIRIKGSNSKGLSFEVERVVITDGRTPLIDMDAKKYPSQGSIFLNIPLPKLSEEIKKKLDEYLAQNPNKKYDITIKTSIGDHYCIRKIETKPPLDPAGNPAKEKDAADKTIAEADKTIADATKKKDEAIKLKEAANTQEEKDAADKTIAEADKTIADATKKKDEAIKQKEATGVSGTIG